MPISRRLFLSLAGAAGAIAGTGARGATHDTIASFETVEALRAVPPGERGDLRRALGRHVRGDGGGGAFWWDEAAGPDDGGG